MSSDQLHVAVIPDGNRRAAKRLMLQPWKGHEWGTKKFEDIVDWCREVGVRKLTVYAFSLKNFESRPKEEINFLFDLFRKEYAQLQNDPRIHEHQIKIQFIGRLELFPKDMQEIMKELMEKTRHYDQYHVTIAMAYDGRAELVDTMKKIAKQVKDGTLQVEDINEEVIADNLYLKDDVDLVIRTSGEKRTSSFLPWQADYAELSFIQDYWPDLTKEEFLACIQEFKQRERRFGK